MIGGTFYACTYSNDHGGRGEEKAQPGKQGETVKLKINQTLENVVGEA